MTFTIERIKSMEIVDSLKLKLKKFRMEKAAKYIFCNKIYYLQRLFTMFCQILYQIVLIISL